MFTTPNTRKVTPEYEITTNIPSIAEFITCSLDGRLWVFRRSRRYYIAVFKWDDFTQKFGFIHSIALNNTNFIARGVDWLLTDNTIVQASDDEPYVFTANLFDDDGESFFYSSLRSKVLSSGIDPITKAAWGLSESNGNSEGYGYFKRSTLLQSVNKHYSMLPAVGDWHIIKNFLVRKADNPLTEAHNSMLNIRPLIPLEFNGSTPAHGCGFDNDIFLTYYNGELWGRGLYHIGRCYILPAVFDESGNPQEFYLYISPDYPRINVAQAEKLNLGVLKIADNVYGFLTSQASSLDEGLCYSSDDPKIFKPSAKQWQEISQSGQMFIDTLNHSGLVLNDDGAIFLNGASYECKGLRQWLAPAGIVDAASEQSVISSSDNFALAVYPQQGFHRESLTGKKLPLSAKAYSGKRLSLGLNGKTIQANSIAGSQDASTIEWENIYKQPVTIEMIHSFDYTISSSSSLNYPIFITKYSTTTTLVGEWYYDEYYKMERIWFYNRVGNPIITVPGTYSWGTQSDGMITYPGLSYSAAFKGFYINPDNGQINTFSASTKFMSSIGQYSDEDLGIYGLDEPRQYYDFYGGLSDAVVDIPRGVTCQNGSLGVRYRHEVCSKGTHTGEYRFRPLVSIPLNVTDWQSRPSTDFEGSSNLSLQGVQIPKNIPQDVTCSASAVFSERNSNVKFLYNIPSALKSTKGILSGKLAGVDNPYWQNFNYWNINSLSEDKSHYTQGLHVALASNEDGYYEKFFVFRSELHPDIFDLKSETERSKLS